MNGWDYDAVCIGAHPDDVEIGMGATCAKMVHDGLRVAIVDLTDGEPTPFGSSERRALEAKRAADALGISERRTLGLPNRYLFDSVEARTVVAEALRDLRPRMVFAPFPNDAHPDHIAASSIVMAARFYSKFTKTDMRGEPFYPNRMYHYMAVHLRLVAEPSFIVECADFLGVKMDALRAYESQFVDNPRNSNVIPELERLAAYWGAVGGVAAGEPFFAVEPFAVPSPDSIL